MKRAILFVALLGACASEAPPRTEVSLASVPSPSASASAAPAAPSASGSASTSVFGRDDANTPAQLAGTALGEADAGAGAELSRDAIHRVVAAHRGAIKLCYEKALAHDPHLEGRVSVRFAIDSSGQVASAASAPPTSMPDANVVSCVLREFRALHFPPHAGAPVSVVYPFIFAAADP